MYINQVVLAYKAHTRFKINLRPSANRNRVHLPCDEGRFNCPLADLGMFYLTRLKVFKQM